MPTKIQTRDLVIKTVLSLIGLNCAFLTAYYVAFGDVFYASAPANQSSYVLLLINANLLFLLISLFGTPRLEKAYRNYALFVIC